MDIYSVLKFVHVAAAMAWVGGGLGFFVASLSAGRDGDRLLALLGDMARLGPVLFMPASLLVLVSGGTLVWLGAWGFDAWIVLALIAAGTSFAMGGAYLGPTLGRIAELARAGQGRIALAHAGPVLRVAKIEMALHLTVVGLMVLKPGWADLHEIAAIALAVMCAISLVGMRPVRPRLL